MDVKRYYGPDFLSFDTGETAWVEAYHYDRVVAERDRLAAQLAQLTTASTALADKYDRQEQEIASFKLDMDELDSLLQRGFANG